MTKINVRSPYFVNIFDANLSFARLDVEIYTGAAHSTGHTLSPTYTLTSTAAGQFGFYVNFEIATLIKDYIATGFNGDYTSSASISTTINVDYQVTKTLTDNSSTTETAVLGLRAFDGYGYFEDGANPELLQGLLISNKIIIKPDDSPLRIPIDNENTNSVAFFNKGEQIYVWTPSIGLNIEDQVQYVSTASTDISSYRDRVEDSGGTFEDNACIQRFLRNETIYPVDKVIVNAVEGVSVLKIQNIEECKYTPYKFTFINKYGVYQDLWFFKRSNLSMKKKEETFRSSTLLSSSGTYNTFEHQDKTFNINAKESLLLNTGFYPEEYNEVFRQFTLSERVWIKYNDKTLPVTVKSSDLSFQTKLNDKLINYTIEVEFAFNKLNSVR